MRNYFVTGLLIWVPLGITLWVLNLLISTMDETLALVPERYHTEHLFGVHVPGMGVILTVLIVFFTGVFAANVLGQRLVLIWEAILARIPIVNSIYNSVKQVSDTLFSPSGQAFRQALLVRFPNTETWTIAFLTGHPGAGVAEHLDGEHVSVYVPTTPNPTGGYFLIVPKDSVIELDMTVDQALKYIISMGVVAPVVKHPNS